MLIPEQDLYGARRLFWRDWRQELGGLIHVPELARFFGIIIRMYAEAGAPHHRPHFHAYYQQETAIYSLDQIDLIAGSLPRQQQRLVEAWGELHRDELRENWERLQEGLAPTRIDPLR